MNTASLLAVVALAVSGAACGQKGPLVLPDAQHPHKKLGLHKPTPAAQPVEGAAAGNGATPAGGNAGEPQAGHVPQQ